MVRAQAREGVRFYCRPAQVSGYLIKLVACLKLEAGNLTSGPASARSQPIERPRARCTLHPLARGSAAPELHAARRTRNGSESHASLRDGQEGIVGNEENSFRRGPERDLIDEQMIPCPPEGRARRLLRDRRNSIVRVLTPRNRVCLRACNGCRVATSCRARSTGEQRSTRLRPIYGRMGK